MKSLALFLFAGMGVIFFSCGKNTELDSPLDPNGNNWHPPVVTAATASIDTAFIKDTVTITAAAVDNGTIMKYAWSKSGAAFIDTTIAGVFKTAFTDTGRHVVFVKAMDNDMAWSIADSCVIAVKLGPPSVKLSAGRTVRTGDSVVITASATDNGTIVKYLWTWMENYMTVSDTTIACSLKVAFSMSDRNVVRCRVMDDDGLFSLPDSSVWTVPVSAPPILTPHRDTTVGQNMSVDLRIIAVDTNQGGGILKYYWDLGANGWDDSTTGPQKTISYPAGGPLQMIVAARNTAGVMSRQDFFTIYFNRPPQTPSVSAPLGTMKWNHYNFSTGKGTLPLLLSATDLDSANKDTLTFALSLGASAASLSNVYTGKAKQFDAPNIDTGATVYWRLVAKDLYGDSAIATGSFKTPPPYPPGMAFIPSGNFQMGQVDIADLVHKVSISAFWMDTTEVTQADYNALMGANPSHFTEKTSLPVEMVSWVDAAKYCNARSRHDGLDTVYGGATWQPDLTKKGYRLPTEAEWEYACRAGGTLDFFWGADTAANTIGQYAWYAGNSAAATHLSAQKAKNAFGLFDICGNVAEWCNDWYTFTYASDSLANPTGPTSGSDRVIRGGGWNNSAPDLYSAARSSFQPEYKSSDVGFRVVLPVK